MVEQPAKAQVELGLHIGRDLSVQLFDLGDVAVQVEGFTGHHECSDDLVQAGAGLFDRAIGEGDTAPIDDVVGQHGGGDLVREWVPGQLFGESFPQDRWEVSPQHPLTPRVAEHR